MITELWQDPSLMFLKPLWLFSHSRIIDLKIFLYYMNFEGTIFPETVKYYSGSN